MAFAVLLLLYRAEVRYLSMSENYTTTSRNKKKSIHLQQAVNTTLTYYLVWCFAELASKQDVNSHTRWSRSNNSQVVCGFIPNLFSFQPNQVENVWLFGSNLNATFVHQLVANFVYWTVVVLQLDYLNLLMAKMWKYAVYAVDVPNLLANVTLIYIFCRQVKEKLLGLLQSCLSVHLTPLFTLLSSHPGKTCH